MRSALLTKISQASVNRAKVALFITFFSCGFIFASWAARIPLIISTLSINSAVMGLLLLCMAVGSLIALVIAGWITTKFPTSSIVVWSSSLFTAGLLLLGSAVALKLLLLAGFGLFIFGLGVGCCDVAMNLAGVNVEKQLKRTLMPRLHAFYSLGNVGGALLAAGLEFARFNFTVPIFAVALTLWITLIFCSRHYISVNAKNGDDAKEQNSHKSNPFAAWLEPRTLAIGFVVLSFGLIEGSAFDWLALGVTTGFDVNGHPPASWLGSLGLALFVIGMTSMRWFGGLLIDKYGRVKILRICTLFVAAGLLIFGLAPHLTFALIGVIFWGIGGALGFPIGMSAASDDSNYAAARIAVVAAIGYCAMLAGPPVLGFLALHLGVRNALLILVIPLFISFFLLPKMRSKS